jgi:hypothetical protein
MCFLAYFCEAQITKLLRQKKVILASPAIQHEIVEKRPLTFMEAMKELSEVRATPAK